MENRLIQIILVSFLMIVPLTVLAQMKEGSGEKKGMMEEGMMSGGGMAMDGMMGMQGRGMGHDMMGMMNMMQAMNQMDLTPEQKKNIQQIRIKHQKEAIPLFGKIQMAGVELQEILLGDPIDAAKVKEKIKEKHDAMAELEMSHVLLVQQVKSHLTPEQQERMESMMEMRPQMEMMGPPMAGPPKEKKPSKKGSEKPADSPKTADPHGH